ncbi:soluble lytic murein transglycosylase [Modicisalibacter ilicicola DSM 19980]|uniref:Soluble lytic murein transglycosylase n=1 Tax=Modicisalibacter ilicicola DSM 19980 TaxID=1121942 RepID=A0A1M5BJ08_9GAMM|nr:transglycosylase SLT domain-containing protein [Halomonas ilicicola]SHF42222.1 soluble lytic murein transglycosylase [Halomonas ilicicola DSM 19980]
MKIKTLKRGLALMTALLLSLPVVADDNADHRMRQALEAARNREWHKIDQAAIEDHVLAGYVEYHRLRDRLPHLDPAVVNDYLQRYADSPLSGWLRGVAQVSYGDIGRHEALLAVSDGEPRGSVRRCHYYTALLDREPQAAAEGGLDLWLTGRSQPAACDDLFDALRERGVIDGQAIWQRQMLAWQNGEEGLVRYLARQLPGSWSDAQATFERLRKDYAAITRVPVSVGPNGASGGDLFTAAMHNFTRADTEAALEAWRKVGPHLPIDETQRHRIEHDLAYYSMAREVNNNEGWVDEALPRLADGDLLELRVRRALAERDWKGVIHWVHAMPDETRQEARWQYWLGRALAKLGDPETANKAYAAAAEQRNFFGFAAADRLGQPYALNLERATFNDAFRRQVANWPAVKRAEALQRIDEPGLARSEWYGAVSRASEEEARALADYALSHGRYATLVQTTIAAEQWDALDWRFPGAYRDSFLRWGETVDVDPFLLMGIARRESAFNNEAVSPVGARGLMQLMPGTAAQVSRQLGIGRPSLDELFDPETNIRLGSTYIRDMLKRYNGNRLAATAAYNAGPGRVDRWLREAPEEFDLFVESIPFRETRDYVQAVLAYQVIFQSLAQGGDTRGIAMLTPDECQVDYDASLLARN